MKNFKKLSLAALTATAAVVSGTANAALATEVTTAISGAGTDGAALGAAVLAVIVAIAAFKYMRKAL